MSVFVPSVFALLAGVAALLAGFRPLRHRRAWRLLAVGCIGWATAGAVEFSWPDASGARVHPTHVGAVALSLAILLAALSVGLSQANRREHLLDCLIIGVVVMGGAFEFLIDSVYDGPVWKLVSQTFLGLTLPVIALGLVRARHRQDRFSLLTLLPICAFPGWITGTGARHFSETSIVPLIATGWILGLLLLGAGALFTWRNLDDSIIANYQELPRHRGRVISVSSVAVVIQIAVSYHALSIPGVNYPVATLMVLSAVLIAIRLNSATRLAERLAERTKERNQLYAVVDSSAAIAGAPDVPSLLHHVGTAVGRALDRTAVEVVFQPLSQTRFLELVGEAATADLGAMVLHETIEQRLSSMASPRAPFVIHAWDAWLPVELAARWRERGKWNVLAIPMVSEHELLGHVQVWSPFDKSEFLPEAVKTAAAVVQEGSLAIQNARLLQGVRKRGNERALLLRVSQAASSSLDLPVVLAEIAQATLGVAAIESTSIELWDPVTDELVVGANEAIPEWQGVPPIGTRFSVDRWPMNREALTGREPLPFTAHSPELGPDALQMMRAMGVGSGVLFPLLAGDQRLGLLKIFSRSINAFGLDEIRLGTEMSNQTALAIQNARLLEEERQRAEERAALLGVSKAATSSLDLYTVLGEIADSTIGVAGIECTAIELWHPETDELEIGAQKSIEDWPDVDEPGTRYSVGYWEQDRQILSSRDHLCLSLNDPELDEGRRTRMQESGTGTILVYPIWAGDQCLGMLDFFSRSEQAFNAATQRLGVEIASQTALAIHNARVLAAEQNRADEWAVLHRVSRAATSSLDLNTVITEIAQAALGIPGAEACTISVCQHANEPLLMIADEAQPDWLVVPRVGDLYPNRLNRFTFSVLSSQQACIVEADDPGIDPDLLAEMHIYGTKSLLALPILRQNDEVGLIYLSSRQPRAFGERALRLGEEIAAQTALAIYNARLLEAERERATEWAVLHRVGRAAIAGLDRRAVLAEIAQACLGIAGTECCTIFSWDKTLDEIIVEADVTVPDWPGTDEPGSRYPLVAGAAEFRAMEQRAPILVHSSDPDLIQQDRDVLHEYGIESLVIIPVWISSEATGIIYLSSRDPEAFDETAIRIGAEIAAQTALAIRNAQLLDETRRYADEQTALLRVSRAVSSGRDLIEVMNEVALASLAIAGAECCEIELLQPGANETQMVAGQHLPGWIHGHTEMGKVLPLGNWPLTREIIDRQTPMILDFDSPRLTEFERSKLFTSNQESSLIVPMVVEGRCVGVMSCYARVRQAFNADSMRLGIDLAGQAAIAIERARMQTALEEQANTDGLTNLLNHRAIQERLDEELARAYRDDSTVAVLMVDLNRFKYVNDTYGHQAGDVVLRSAAATLKASVRAYDIVGRYGGDEFMVILPATDAVEAVTVADRIVDNAATTEVRIGPRSRTSLNLSVGLSVFPAQASTRQELIDAADRAMYQAKQRRRHTSVTGPLLLPSLTG